MIQVQTDNYGLVDFSQESALELTTQAMAFGTPQISGWYCKDLTPSACQPISVFYDY